MSLIDIAKDVVRAYDDDSCGAKLFEIHMNRLRDAIKKTAPVKVSPLEFVEMTYEKEHLVGRPVVWAQWPNEE